MPHRTAARRAAALGVLAPGVRLPRHRKTRKEETGVPTVRQRVLRAKAQARPPRPADPAGAQRRIQGFVPCDPLAVPHLPLVRGLVRTAAPVDAIDAGELLSAAAGHAAWLAATGIEVTEESLVDPDLVQRWALHALADLSAGTAANYRSRLSRLAVVVHGSARPAPLHASDPCEPYTRAEENAFVVWAGSLRTDRLRLDLTAAVLLGFGIGATAAELVETEGGDVTVTRTGAVVVRVDEPRARVVPVRARCAQPLLDLARDAGPGPLFKPGVAGRLGKNAISNTVTAALKDADPRLPRLTAQRMRATWIVRHLEAGTDLRVLAAAAGLDDIGSLDRYVRRLPPLHPAAVTRALTGSRA